MKTTKVLQAISFLVIFVIAVSCRSNRSTTGTQYPRSAPTPTPSKETTVYVESAKLPPGQAKKVYGGQSAKAYAPGQQKKYANRYPLVIVYTPAIVIHKYSDGRYYYRSNAGHTYWKGHDGTYYIDERHLKGMEYEGSEYDDWKFKGQKNDKAQGPKGKEIEDKLNVNPKSKDDEDIAKVKEQKGNGQSQKVKDDEQKGNGQNQKAKDGDQKGNGQNQKGKDEEQKEKSKSEKPKDNDQKGKDQTDQKTKDNDSKGKEQTDEKAKDDNSQKAKGKSKDKG